MPTRIEGLLAHAGGPFLFQPTRAVSVAIFSHHPIWLPVPMVLRTARRESCSSAVSA